MSRVYDRYDFFLFVHVLLYVQRNGQPKKKMLSSFFKNVYDISAVGFSGGKGFGIFRVFFVLFYFSIKVY